MGNLNFFLIRSLPFLKDWESVTFLTNLKNSYGLARLMLLKIQSIMLVHVCITELFDGHHTSRLRHRVVAINSGHYD